MKLQLIEDWRKVWHRAWSMRLGIAATIFGAGEVLVQFAPSDWVSWVGPGRFAALAALTSLAANVSRLVAQPKMKGGAK